MLVPVLNAGPLVHELRMRYDPSARAGVPPHVTLMFPFLPAHELTEGTTGELEALLSGTSRFHFSLSRVRDFPQGVVYLEPEPASPFIELSNKITESFGMLPFAGEFGDTPVPHLTLTTPESGMTRQQVEAQIEPLLPIRLVAEKAWLLVGSNAITWTIAREMNFK